MLPCVFLIYLLFIMLFCFYGDVIPKHCHNVINYQVITLLSSTDQAIYLKSCSVKFFYVVFCTCVPQVTQTLPYEQTVSSYPFLTVYTLTQPHSHGHFYY